VDNQAREVCGAFYSPPKGNLAIGVSEIRTCPDRGPDMSDQPLEKPARGSDMSDPRT
jgi:hypothetical protein